MSQTSRTLTFLGLAAASVAAAASVHIATRPATLSEYSNEGKEFFEDFQDPNTATSLRVAAFNDETAQVDVFNVEFKNGDWRIPSHHNYPADGADRLAKTATSVIGIRRGALVSTSKEDHKRLGVLDPLDDSITGTEGRGDRITLADRDNVLADFIIGNKVEDQENTYNVRRADEDQTYRAVLDIDISTKFADWIEPDLLDIRRADLREIDIDRYRIDETRGTLIPGDISQLTRPNDTDPWTLKGITEETEKVKTSTVNQIISALDDLRIVGVRPKPPGLSADLKSSGSIKMDTLAFLDLQSRGFFIDSRGALVSNEGEVRLSTAEGLQYTLRFGEVFTGSDVELEIGKDAAAEDKQAADADKPADADTPADEAVEDTDALAKSRYVFITANFDEALVEGPGEAPTKPDAPADAATSETKPEGDADKDATEAKSDTADGQPASEKSDADAEKTPDPQAEYKEALAQYERDLASFEQRKKSREEMLKQGRERAEELNARFADWYYVISADSFDKIRVGHDELVEAKAPAENPAPEIPATPADSTPAPETTAEPPATPEATPAPEMKEEAETKESTDSPASELGTPESSKDTPAEKPPAAADTPAEKAPAETPPPTDGKENDTPEDEKPAETQADKPAEESTEP